MDRDLILIVMIFLGPILFLIGIPIWLFSPFEYVLIHLGPMPEGYYAHTLGHGIALILMVGGAIMTMIGLVVKYYNPN